MDKGNVERSAFKEYLASDPSKKLAYTYEALQWWSYFNYGQNILDFDISGPSEQNAEKYISDKLPDSAIDVAAERDYYFGNSAIDLVITSVGGIQQEVDWLKSNKGQIAKYVRLFFQMVLNGSDSNGGVAIISEGDTHDSDINLALLARDISLFESADLMKRASEKVGTAVSNAIDGNEEGVKSDQIIAYNNGIDAIENAIADDASLPADVRSVKLQRLKAAVEKADPKEIEELKNRIQVLEDNIDDRDDTIASLQEDLRIAKSNETAAKSSMVSAKNLLVKKMAKTKEVIENTLDSTNALLVLTALRREKVVQ